MLSQPNRNTNQDEKDQEILFDKDNWNTFGGDQDNGDEDYIEFSIIVILELSCISVKEILNSKWTSWKRCFDRLSERRYWMFKLTLGGR